MRAIIVLEEKKKRFIYLQVYNFEKRVISFIVTAQLATEGVIVHPVKGDFQNE